jgi:predicted secreted hydrolase
LAIQEPDTPEPLNAWQSRQVFMGHFAITTPERHLSFQRYSRGRANHALARAGVIAAPFEAWLDDWTLRSSGESFLPLEVKARQGDHSLHFDLESDKPLVLHGQDGFSQKHPNGGGSFYYSQPFLTVNGELELAGERIPVTGKAWIDHEWSSQFLQGDQEGWDWFSLHLENGEKLMLFQLRQSVDSAADKPYRYGVLIRTDGSTVQLDPHEIQLSVLKTTELEGRKLPLSWQVELPQIERSFEIQALHPDQWMEVDFPYWEGVIGAFGDGPQNRGPGYMELTGYPVE